jgi:hypothetical protein
MPQRIWRHAALWRHAGNIGRSCAVSEVLSLPVADAATRHNPTLQTPTHKMDVALEARIVALRELAARGASVEDLRDLQLKLYREIGLMAVAEALGQSTTEIGALIDIDADIAKAA